EDGIRHRNVTGVQTCALPICGAELPDRLDAQAQADLDGRTVADDPIPGAVCDSTVSPVLPAPVGHCFPGRVPDALLVGVADGVGPPIAEVADVLDLTAVPVGSRHRLGGLRFLLVH